MTDSISGVELRLTDSMNGVDKRLTDSIDGVDRRLTESLAASRTELLAAIRTVPLTREAGQRLSGPV